MKINQAIQYFEEEVEFYERMVSNHSGEEWMLGRIEASKLAAEALRAAQARESNPYWASICEMADKQRAKGMCTYGKGLEDNPLSFVERLDYLAEELIDALFYIEHLKAWFADKEKTDGQIR